jgi:methylthioribose-1-phosphate isomerase
MQIKSIEWADDSLVVIDQTQLPEKLIYLKIDTLDQLLEAIQKLKIRGAPLLGAAGAFGIYLGIRNSRADIYEINNLVRRSYDKVVSARPTAVNLKWGAEQAKEAAQNQVEIASIKKAALDKAIEITLDDFRRCESIGKNGSDLITEGGILTHCNTGALATCGIGTAFGVLWTAHRQGKKISVFAGETRPLLQGARLTAWECQQLGMPCTLITDNMAGMVMRKKLIHIVIVGADRIAKNGDVANKIGTYSLAVLAKQHQIPFYVAAPLSTFDFHCPDGESIPIEERDPDEVRGGFGKLTAPKDVNVFNPAFDVTPHEYITAFITEKGISKPPFQF